MTNLWQPSGSPITVVTLTLNEQHNLNGMLDSLPPDWPVLISDAGSSDQTTAIALERGCKVIQQDNEAIASAGGNFDVERNAAANHTNSPWLLFLDADERLTPQLVAEIKRQTRDASPTFAAFSIPRTNLFWGKPGRLLGEDRQVRLVQNGAGSFQGTLLHQPITVDGAIGQLNHVMIHHNVRSLGDVARRFRRYVPQLARVQSDRTRLADVARRPFGLFRYYLIQNQGYKDGIRGFAMATIYALEQAAALGLGWFRKQRQ